MQMRDLVISIEALKKLASLDINVKLAYTIAKFVKEVEKELVIYEEKRQDLFKLYGEEQEKGTFKIEEENQEKFSEKIEELLDLQLGLDIPAISIEDLQSEEITLAASDLVNLWFLIDLE